MTALLTTFKCFLSLSLTPPPPCTTLGETVLYLQGNAFIVSQSVTAVIALLLVVLLFWPSVHWKSHS